MPPSIATVFVTPFGLAHKTTVWARTLPLAKGLVSRGHSATILVPPWDSPQSAGDISLHDGVRIEQMALHRGPLAVVRRMLRRIEQIAPQVVHIVKPRAHAGLVQWWLWQSRALTSARRRARPALLLDVDDWEQAWAPVNNYPRHVTRFLAWQEEWGIRHADGITAASQWLIERTASVAPAMPRLYLPNGVTFPPGPVEDLSPAPNPWQVLFLSRFVEVAPEWLARCWAAVRQAAPDAKLTIAGQALSPTLEAGYRQALAGAPGVEWRGFVPPDCLADLYAQSACAIFPATPAPLQQAKCSVRLATTLLHGVPVVASAVGEQSAYGAAGAAYLVAAEATPEQFGAAVAYVLCTPAARATLAAQARAQLMEKYNWDLLVTKLEQFYAAIAARVPSR
jgi:glycosyltransferase involved in cell wall biosynthesis